MDQLAKVVSGQVLTSGIYPSMEGDAPAFWADGENVIFDEESVRKEFGQLVLGNFPARPTGFKSTFADREPRLFAGAGQKAYRYRSADGFTEIGSFASSGGIYQFVPWDTWCLINNAVDPLKLWKNSGAAAAITAPFTRANACCAYGLQAFVGGTDLGGNRVHWCAINDIETWVPTLLNSAGDLNLRELAGDIVAMVPLGGAIGVYSHINAGLFVAIGGTTSFGFRRPIKGVHAISPHSVVSLGDRHFGLTRENAFVTDLVSFQYIDEPAMRTYLRDNADWSRMSEVYGWPNWNASMIRWTVPSLAGGSFGIGYRWDRQTWTKFDDDVLLGEESGPFPDMMFGTATRLLRQNKASANIDSDPLTSYIQTKPLDFGRSKKLKRLQLIRLTGRWSGDVTVKVGYTNNVNETPTWAFTKAIDNDLYPDEMGTNSEGAFVHFRVETSAMDANWRLSGIEFYGAFTGDVA